MINKNRNLQKIYDPKLNKFIEYGKEINIYLEDNPHKEETVNYLFKNPQKYNLSQINKIKFNLNEYKENYIPTIEELPFHLDHVNIIGKMNEAQQ